MTYDEDFVMFLKSLWMAGIYMHVHMIHLNISM